MIALPLVLVSDPLDDAGYLGMVPGELVLCSGSGARIKRIIERGKGERKREGRTPVSTVHCPESQ